MLNKFEFIRPKNLAEALNYMQEQRESLCVLNGGTDIMVKLNSGIEEGLQLLYIHGLEELQGIELTEDALVIGGAVTYTQLENSPLIDSFPCVHQALIQLASPPIRNMATPAGNIATASPAGDFNLVLLALDGQVEMCSRSGSRIVPSSSVFRAAYSSDLKSGELIRSIRLPLPKEKRYGAFCKLGRRKGQDISRVSVAVSFALSEGLIKESRIAVGAVNSVPFRSFTFEKIVDGKSPSDALCALEGQFPPESHPRRAYKKHIVTPMIQRTIQEALNQKGS